MKATEPCDEDPNEMNPEKVITYILKEDYDNYEELDDDDYPGDSDDYKDILVPVRSLSPVPSDESVSPVRRYTRFVSRVLRASVPLQALMLVLLGAASLVPTVEEDYSCLVVNNLYRSFDPTINFPNPPPI